jgi:hypothetical protein
MLVYFEYNTTEITNISETWYSKCYYSDSNPNPMRPGHKFRFTWDASSPFSSWKKCYPVSASCLHPAHMQPCQETKTAIRFSALLMVHITSMITLAAHRFQRSQHSTMWNNSSQDTLRMCRHRIKCIYLTASALPPQQLHHTSQYSTNGTAKIIKFANFLYDIILNRCLCFAATFEYISIQTIYEMLTNTLW